MVTGVVSTALVVRPPVATNVPPVATMYTIWKAFYDACILPSVKKLGKFDDEEKVKESLTVIKTWIDGLKFAKKKGKGDTVEEASSSAEAALAVRLAAFVVNHPGWVGGAAVAGTMWTLWLTVAGIRRWGSRTKTTEENGGYSDYYYGRRGGRRYYGFRRHRRHRRRRRRRRVDDDDDSEFS